MFVCEQEWEQSRRELQSRIDKTSDDVTNLIKTHQREVCMLHTAHKNKSDLQIEYRTKTVSVWGQMLNSAEIEQKQNKRLMKLLIQGRRAEKAIEKIRDTLSHSGL